MTAPDYYRPARFLLKIWYLGGTQKPFSLFSHEHLPLGAHPDLRGGSRSPPLLTVAPAASDFRMLIRPDRWTSKT
jgi:hypothetical protein